MHLYEEHGLGLPRASARDVCLRVLGRAEAKRLLLARDRLGVKPLFYCLERERLVFASELRALRELLARPLEVDPQAVYDFFGFRYIPAPRTFYRGVEKLLPGHYLLADARGRAATPYWDVPPEEDSLRSGRRMSARRSWSACANRCACG